MTMHVPEGPKPSEQWLGKGNGSNRCGSVVEEGPLDVGARNTASEMRDHKDSKQERTDRVLHGGS